MSVIAKLLGVAARHLRADEVTSPTTPSPLPLPLPLPLPILKSPCPAPDAAQPAPLNQDRSMSPFFVPSPLAEGSSLPQAEIDRLCAIYDDYAIQRAAGNLRWKLDHLADLALYRCLIAQAIATANRMDISPIEALRRMDEAADDAIESARVDRLPHDAAVKARSDRLQPLAFAVARVGETAAQGRESILRHLNAAPGLSKSAGLERFEHLQAAGLNQAQIMALGGPEPEDDVRRKHKLRDQFAECNRVLGQCERYNADPMRSTHHLAGLGLDDVIAQVGAASHSGPHA